MYILVIQPPSFLVGFGLRIEMFQSITGATIVQYNIVCISLRSSFTVPRKKHPAVIVVESFSNI